MWRQRLKASQAKEGKLASNRWVQLANVSKIERNPTLGPYFKEKPN